MIPMQSIQRFDLWILLVMKGVKSEEEQQATTIIINNNKNHPPTMQKQIISSSHFFWLQVKKYRTAVLYKNVFHSFLPPLTD